MLNFRLEQEEFSSQLFYLTLAKHEKSFSLSQSAINAMKLCYYVCHPASPLAFCCVHTRVVSVKMCYKPNLYVPSLIQFCWQKFASQAHEFSQRCCLSSLKFTTVVVRTQCSALLSALQTRKWGSNEEPLPRLPFMMSFLHPARESLRNDLLINRCRRVKHLFYW